MRKSAPRVDPRLVAALSRLDNGHASVADLHRTLGTVAENLGLPQPSYQRVRLIVRDIRRGRAEPGVGDVLLDIALRNKPPEAIITYLSDHPRRPCNTVLQGEDTVGVDER
jgi:hypothetical protein